MPGPPSKPPAEESACEAAANGAVVVKRATTARRWASILNAAKTSVVREMMRILARCTGSEGEVAVREEMEKRYQEASV
jgi:hypothetical protein